VAVDAGPIRRQGAKGRLSREGQEKVEVHLCLVTIPTFRAVMIRKRGQGGESRGRKNDLTGEAEQALMPTQIPHSGYSWVIPGQREREKRLTI
jgi:hypothetical protein